MTDSPRLTIKDVAECHRLCDSMTGMLSFTKKTEEPWDGAAWFKELALMTKGLEIFLIEAEPNDYQPPTPQGFFGMRSHKNRVFLPLNKGCYPDSEEISKLLDAAKRYPLTP